MKPVEPDRLADTMERVRSRLANKRNTDELERLRTVINEVAPNAADNLGSMDDDVASTRFEKLINVKDRGPDFPRRRESIERIDAAGDYMCIYTADNSLILRRNDEGSGKSVLIRAHSSGCTAVPSSIWTRCVRSSPTPTANASSCSNPARR